MPKLSRKEFARIFFCASWTITAFFSSSFAHAGLCDHVFGPEADLKLVASEKLMVPIEELRTISNSINNPKPLEALIARIENGDVVMQTKLSSAADADVRALTHTILEDRPKLTLQQFLRSQRFVPINVLNVLIGWSGGAAIVDYAFHSDTGRLNDAAAQGATIGLAIYAGIWSVKNFLKFMTKNSAFIGHVEWNMRPHQSTNEQMRSSLRYFTAIVTAAASLMFNSYDLDFQSHPEALHCFGGIMLTKLTMGFALGSTIFNGSADEPKLDPRNALLAKLLYEKNVPMDAVAYFQEAMNMPDGTSRRFDVGLFVAKKDVDDFSAIVIAAPAQ